MLVISSVYFASLTSITFVTIGIQILALYLIYNFSPKNMNRYRPYLMLNTVYDLIYTFVIGVLLQGSSAGPENDPSIVFNGLLVWLFEVNGARVGLVLFYASFALVAIGQTMCLLYRYLVFHTKRNDIFQFIFGCKTRVKLMHASIYFGVLAGGVIAAMTLPLRLTETEYGSVGVYIDNQNRKTDTVKFVIVCITLLTLWELSYFGIVVRILQLMKPKIATFSPNTIRLHKQLTWLLMAQAISPLICLVVPVFLAAIDKMIVDKPFGHQRIKASFLASALQMTINSCLTILVVGPFRVRCKRLIYRVFVCLRCQNDSSTDAISPIKSISNNSTVSHII